MKAPAWPAGLEPSAAALAQIPAALPSLALQRLQPLRPAPQVRVREGQLMQLFRMIQGSSPRQGSPRLACSGRKPCCATT